jgi:hypothetical protein
LLLSAILSARSIIVIKFKDTLWEKQRLPCVSIFAVRILSGAWQRGFPGKKQFVVRFYVGARQTNSLPCVFSLTHGKHFSPIAHSPHVCPVNMFVAFVVR